MKKLLLVGFLALLMSSVAAQDTTPEATAEATLEPNTPLTIPGEHLNTETIGGIERSYRVYVPANYDASKAYPLVFMLHGASGTGAWMERFTAFDKLADSEGIVVVYPDGVNNVWNDGRPNDPRTAANIDDVGFISHLIDTISEQLNIDNKRVYSAGYSMGGMMSFRLSCELSDKIAAIASVASTFPNYLSQACKSSPLKPTLVIQGTLDPVVSWGGITDTAGIRVYLSASETATYWAVHNGCEGKADQIVDPDTAPKDGTRVRHVAFNQCKDDASVVLYGVENGGHTWPSSATSIPAQFGLSSQDINASAVIWDFFKAHTLAGDS
jgi:polyhydroxybutyrate depolymerase